MAGMGGGRAMQPRRPSVSEAQLSRQGLSSRPKLRPSRPPRPPFRPAGATHLKRRLRRTVAPAVPFPIAPSESKPSVAGSCVDTDVSLPRQNRPKSAMQTLEAEPSLPGASGDPHQDANDNRRTKPSLEAKPLLNSGGCAGPSLEAKPLLSSGGCAGPSLEAKPLLSSGGCAGLSLEARPSLGRGRCAGRSLGAKPSVSRGGLAKPSLGTKPAPSSDRWTKPSLETGRPLPDARPDRSFPKPGVCPKPRRPVADHGAQAAISDGKGNAVDIAEIDDRAEFMETIALEKAALFGYFDHESRPLSCLASDVQLSVTILDQLVHVLALPAGRRLQRGYALSPHPPRS